MMVTQEDASKTLGYRLARRMYHFAISGDQKSRAILLSNTELPNRWGAKWMTITAQLEVILTEVEERFRVNLNLRELEWARDQIFRYAHSRRYPVEMVYHRIKDTVLPHISKVPKGWRQKQEVLRNPKFRGLAIESFAKVPAHYPIGWLRVRTRWCFENAEGRFPTTSYNENYDDGNDDDWSGF